MTGGVTALPLVSASQISKYRECARKWAWLYLAGIESPSSAAAALGTECDDTQLQPYLRDARAFDFSRESGYIVAAGIAYLPKPQTPGLQVQKYFEMPSPTWIDAIGPQGRTRQHIGFGYRGYMDLWLPDSGAVPDMPGGAPYVGDFKTTSDLKWAKSEQALSEDVQAIIYATDAIYETGALSVDLSWMYFQTRGPRKAKRTYLRVTRDHVAREFTKINDTAIEMKRVRSENPHPLDLPPNIEQCEAYGGCPYRDKCNLSPMQIIEAHAAKATRALLGGDVVMSNTNGNSTANMFAALKAKKAAAQGAIATAGSPPAPQVTNSEELAQHIAANPRAAFLAAPASVPVERHTIVGTRPDGTNVYYEAPLGINPPEKSLPPAPPVGTAAPKRGPGRLKKDAAAPTPAPEDPRQLLLATTPDAPTPAVAAPSISLDVDTTKIIRVVTAVRAAADAFLVAMGTGG